MTVLKTRFLVKDAGGYTISGFPGVAFQHLAGNPYLDWDTLQSWYDEITSRDTEIMVSPEQTMREVLELTLESLEIDPEVSSPAITSRVYIGSSTELAWTDELEKTLSEVLDYFDDTNCLYAFILLKNLAGETLQNEDKGVRYFFHSAERGRHNTPHIHVQCQNSYTASVSLIDCSILAGHLPAKIYRVVRKRIEKDGSKLIKQWNAKTDGIRFDPNYPHMRLDE